MRRRTPEIARHVSFGSLEYVLGGGAQGGGVQRGKDVLCEAAKVAQNALYNTAAAGRKFDCERLKAQEEGVCEIEKAGEIMACELGKGTLDAIGRTGNFANLEIDSRISTDGVKVCVPEFKLSPALDKVQLALEVSGEAAVDMDLKFIPLDIVGHLACQWPWTDTEHFTATLREGRIPLSASVSLIARDGKTHLMFHYDDVEVKARLEPGPTEYLMLNKNAMLSCAGLRLLAPLVIPLTPFIPQLRGEIDQVIPGQEWALEIGLPSVEINNVEIPIGMSETEHAVVLNGGPEPGLKKE